MKAFLRATALMALCLAPSLSAQSLEEETSAFKDLTSKKAWHANVEETERGHLIGNPDADEQLIMFVSYACKGCHDFAFRGDPELDIALLAPGLLNLEIRQRFNHPVDLPLSLLAQCGEPAKFKVNHAMLMRAQARWKERWDSASAFNRDGWSRSTLPARRSLVAALDFDDMMARRRGYSRMDLGTCLSDRRAAAKLAADSMADAEEFGLPNSPESFTKPYFALNGELLEGVHSWDALYELLSGRFKPEPASE
ncbi:DsbA family protein [Erythrobacter rubeus]|uniref:Thioredoxin domain-containing protein n=1 Tax=Erythrobacter rubeus TaxID=2760803 RepID=A0ABR8KT70_9SPHN|nr:thioredoxin domain-containing protein [Erythrobacter rubeus]MBD2841336.1 thioredoxin domain-containing protein [Erythrobacter rubeus]